MQFASFVPKVVDFREAKVHTKLMEMQKSEMQNLRDWMTGMEDRISQMDPIRASSIDAQQTEQLELEADISQHQVCCRLIKKDP